MSKNRTVHRSFRAGVSAARHHNFVCVKCRTVRRYRENGKPRCGTCNKAMVGIGMKWRVPKRTDDKAWAVVEKMVIDILKRQAKREAEIAEMKKKETQSHDSGG